jgi:hypothetical protein
MKRAIKLLDVAGNVWEVREDAEMNDIAIEAKFLSGPAGKSLAPGERFVLNVEQTIAYSVNSHEAAAEASENTDAL